MGDRFSGLDHWCIGVLCYELLVGRPPFESSSSQETYQKIVSCRIQFPDFVSSGARSLIMSLLQLKSSNRISLKEVRQHPWIVENAERNDEYIRYWKELN